MLTGARGNTHFPQQIPMAHPFWTGDPGVPQLWEILFSPSCGTPGLPLMSLPSNNIGRMTACGKFFPQPPGGVPPLRFNLYSIYLTLPLFYWSV